MINDAFRPKPITLGDYSIASMLVEKMADACYEFAKKKNMGRVSDLNVWFKHIPSDYSAYRLAGGDTSSDNVQRNMIHLYSVWKAINESERRKPEQPWCDNVFFQPDMEWEEIVRVVEKVKSEYAVDVLVKHVREGVSIEDLMA